MRASDVPRFENAFAGHDVTSVITVTPPIHRWCSAWQELVKHGLSQTPADAAHHVMSFSSLLPGRLEELTMLVPANKRVIRVVRTSPHEDSLAHDLATLTGIPWPSEVRAAATRNVSLGANVELLRRINRDDLALGVMDKAGRQLLDKLGADLDEIGEPTELTGGYHPPEDVWLAARLEYEFLTAHAESRSVLVSDPHAELNRWLDQRPPDWYVAASNLRVDSKALAPSRPETDLLWEVRQERTALRLRLEAALERSEILEAKVDRLSRVSGPDSTRAAFRSLTRAVRRSLSSRFLP